MGGTCSQFDGDIFYAASLSEVVDFSSLHRHLEPGWLEEALAATGTASVRKRRLPAELVVWTVIGMAMARALPIPEVVEKLDLVIPDSGAKPRVAKSAITKARQRLGEEPLKWLFEKTASKWGHERARVDEWRGLALYGVDGTTLRIPDSDVNREHFGLANGGHRGMSGYPLVRMTSLVALRSHLACAADFGPYAQGEKHYAKTLWEQIPDDSLTVLDRNFAYPADLLPITLGGKNRHWLTRARAKQEWDVIKRLGAKDALVRIKVSRRARKGNPDLPESLECRAIAYNHHGEKASWLLTSLVDPRAFPKKEVVALYHERWEHELAYDELKTEMLMSEESLRSKTVDGVRQEIWGVLLAYNLIRMEMAAVADEAEVKPIEISFVHALRHLLFEWQSFGMASPGALPKRVRQARENLVAWILAKRRPERRYPRAVKRKMSNYAKKRRAAPARRRKGAK
jgi:hypothetical protein